jgi:hypothetical protein
METLENPADPLENSPVIPGVVNDHGRQADRIQ